MINDRYYKRRFVITAIAIAVVVVYIIRLFVLQVVDSSTIDKAESNAVVRQTVYPPRGLIYDRNGELLVFNQPIYDVTMIMREQRDGFDTLGFCQVMQLTEEQYKERVTEMRKTRGYSYYTPQVFLSQLRKEDIAVLQESLYRFPGIGIRKRTLRDYRYATAAQVLGSVGEVSQKDLDRDNYYAPGDYAGRDGIEKTYETVLRGEKGVTCLMRDAHGRIQGSYKDGELDRDAKAGEDLTLTLDIRLQLLAEELLQGKIGSAVAIEPETGEILALASNPTWNPSLLVGRQRSKNYQELAADPTRPLYNRATQAQYPPGSTFKTLQTLVCMQDGPLKSTTLYPCSGPGSTPIKCTHHHGSPVTLGGALEQSCNPYFWYAFRDFLEQDSHPYDNGNQNFRRRFEQWREDVMRFGIGQRFADSDLSEQSPGSIPSTKFYDRYYGKTGWKALTIRSLSIGQGEVLLTPLQLCNMAATIANNGWYITPHLNKTDSMLTHRHETGIDERYFHIVKDGMARVMTNGTGRWYALDSIASGGKTGTAQAGKGRKDHAIFIGIAPIDNPKIAVAVIVENAGFGATWAAPVASLMMEQYLTGGIRRKELKTHISSSVLNTDVKKR